MALLGPKRDGPRPRDAELPGAPRRPWGSSRTVQIADPPLRNAWLANRPAGQNNSGLARPWAANEIMANDIMANVLSGMLPP
jgi:hypothetical protein